MSARLRCVLLLAGAATLQAAAMCSSAMASCTACTTLAGCGWCDGKAFDPSGQRSPCLPLAKTNSTWTCEGQFKNAGQCECAGTDVPTAMVFPWRGFYIDGTVKGEVALAFTNTAGGQGRWTMKTQGAAARGANVTTFSGCPKNVLQISFDDGAKMACSYRLGWQSGGDSQALALGCNANASAPTDFDMGAQTLQLYTCTDPSHCDFDTQSDLVATARGHVIPPPRVVTTDSHGHGATCSALTTCASCGAAVGCSWCLGRLEQGGKVLPGIGHCFGVSDGLNDAPNASFSCSGLTLQQDCSVYKCPWYAFYDQTPPNCSALTGACGAVTTADDPDFARDYPAAAYLSSQECSQSCVDPTVGCSGASCSKTHTCDPSSSCASCETVDLPRVLQGLEVSNGFSSGIWTFAFELSTDKRVYTAVNVTNPSGTVAHYSVRAYTGSTAIFSLGTAEHGVRLDGLSNTGALGKNVYLALSNGPKVPAFGSVMYDGTGSEFALLACEFDYAGKPVSGQYKPLACKIGLLDE